MRKILIHPHTYSAGGGAERVLNTLIDELSRWYEIDLIERWEYNTFIYSIPENVHKLKSITYSPQLVKNKGWNKYIWMFHRKFLSLLLIVCPKLVYRYYIRKKYNYEISFNYLFPSILIANSTNQKSKKIMWIHSDLYLLDYQRCKLLYKPLSFLKFQIQKLAFIKADKIVAISKNTYNSILDLYPFTKNKLCIIHNGYNFTNFIDKSKDFEVETPKRFRLSFLGRLEPRKNVITAVRSLNRLLENGNIDAELLIIGDGECRLDAEKEAKKNNDHFQFLGFKSNPYPYLKSSNALLVTSETEGFPTVIIEAISLGIPVITTNVGGVDEIIIPGVNGLVVNNNVEDIVEKITYMANNYSKFKNNIESTVSKFTAESWGLNVKYLLESLG